jgi:glycosyltransferase involved in cell wall biosynthesis
MSTSNHTSVQISVLLATYNWPQALRVCLQSLKNQSDLDFEIVIADDGSKHDTQLLIAQEQAGFPVPIRHLWQEDFGFRKSKILNLAINDAQAPYLVFLDGDCIVQPDFIHWHKKLSQQSHLVTGSRILMSPKFTKRIFDETDLNGYLPSITLSRLFNPIFAARHRSRGDFNKFAPLLLKIPPNPLRAFKPHVWRRIKGCNMACWREDALRIGGFDESFEGWGHEDADFVFRLEDKGVRRLSGSYATEVLHLWHPNLPNNRAQINKERVLARISNGPLKTNPDQTTKVFQMFGTSQRI